MPEITYLMNRDASGFFTQAKKFFEARRDADSVVVDTPPGQPWTLGEVLTDLRVRAKEGEVFPVINLVAHGTGFGAVQFPISATRSTDDGGIITLDMLKNAVTRAGSDGFPPVLGAPAVTAATKVCFYGCDVGRDAQFMALLGQLFGPDVTVYAPLRMAVFREVNGRSEYRLARSWSTAYTKDVLRTDPVPAATRTEVGNLLKARFPAATADITAALAGAGTQVGPTYFFSGHMDVTFEDAGTPATADPPIRLESAVLPAGTVDDTTVALTLTAPDFKANGPKKWTAWVATLGQVIEAPVSLEDPAQYRKTVLTAPKRSAVSALTPDRDPLPVPPDAIDPDPDPEPSEDEMKFYGKHRAVVTAVGVDGTLTVEVPAQTLSDLQALPCFPPVPEELMRMPEVGDDVWVEFEGGDPDHPIWTGVMRAPDMPRDLDLSVEGNLKLQAGIDLELRSAATLTTTAAMANSSVGNQTVQAGMTRFHGVVQCDTMITNSVISASYTPGAGNVW